MDDVDVSIDFGAVFKGANVCGIDRQSVNQFSCSKSITHFWTQPVTLGALPDSSYLHLICVIVARPHTCAVIRNNIITWAAFDTGGPEAVLSMRIRNQLVQVGVVTMKAWAGVLTHPIILEVPTGQTVFSSGSRAPRGTMLIATVAR